DRGGTGRRMRGLRAALRRAVFHGSAAAAGIPEFARGLSGAGYAQSVCPGPCRAAHACRLGFRVAGLCGTGLLEPAQSDGATARAPGPLSILAAVSRFP